VLRNTRIVSILLVFAICPAWAQVSANESSFNSIFSVPLRDASNTEFDRSFPHQESPAIRGTTSVTEMEHPLEGKSLESLLKAQKLLETGNTEKGMELLNKLTTDRAAAPYAFGALGTAHVRSGDYRAAVTELDAAVALSPSVAAYHSNLAFALANSGRFEEGLQEARKALQLDPGHSKYRLVAGQILLALGRKEEAEFHLRKAAVDLSGARELLAKYFAK
jgi:Flp pilus assembly protein TadD